MSVVLVHDEYPDGDVVHGGGDDGGRVKYFMESEPAFGWVGALETVDDGS